MKVYVFMTLNKLWGTARLRFTMFDPMGKMIIGLIYKKNGLEENYKNCCPWSTNFMEMCAKYHRNVVVKKQTNKQTFYQPEKERLCIICHPDRNEEHSDWW